MDPNAFKRAKALFDEAVELPPDEREAFVRQRAEGDPDALEAALELLAHDHTNRPILETSARTSAESAGPPTEHATLQTGTTVGAYTIDAVIGAGGFGVVYRATQSKPNRDVALKLIRPGLASPKLLKRFELEAELLGRLHHPGIAQVYEAGALETPHGTQPFFAMELIEGQPLSRWIAQTNPSVRTRLELFTQIADAVQHAHAKGVLHRDLKPSNILVTEDGAPRILDFGVARAIDADLALTTIQTEVGQLIGTIPYMSPEQAAADPDALDTRSDVYTLGVVLYEMLAGRLPYDMSRRMVHEAVRIIREDEPSRLSSVNRALRGDVETIVAKALEKEPDRRYQAASDLAADVRRHLHDEPIVARPPSTAYQLRKFARRNKTLVGGLAATFLVLLAGIIATSWQAVSATRARDQAQRAAEFQAAMLADVDPNAMGRDTIDNLRAEITSAMQAREATPDQINDALARLDQLLIAANPTNIGTPALDANILAPAVDAAAEEFSDNPVLQARLLQSITDARANLGLVDQALQTQERALELRRSSLGNEHPDTLESLEKLGEIHGRKGQYEEALQDFTEVYETRRQTLGPSHPKTLGALASRATVLSQLQRLDEAMPLFEQAIDGLTRELGPEDPQTNKARSVMAVSLMDLERFEEALEILIETRRVHERDQGPDANDTLMDTNNIAGCYFNLGQFDNAADTMIRVAETFRTRHGDTHPQTASATNNASMLLNRAGQPQQALTYARLAYDATRTLYPRESPKFVLVSNSMSVVLIALGRFDEAEPYALDAVNVAQDTLGPNHPYTARCIANTANLYDKWHEAKPAAGHDESAQQWRDKLPPPPDPAPDPSPDAGG